MRYTVLTIISITHTFLELNLSFILSDCSIYTANGLEALSPLEDRKPTTMSTTSKHSLRLLIVLNSLIMSIHSLSSSETYKCNKILITRKSINNGTG